MPRLCGRCLRGSVHGGLAWRSGRESARGGRSVVAKTSNCSSGPWRNPSHTAKLVNSFTSMTEAAGLGNGLLVLTEEWSAWTGVTTPPVVT
jgi:hypothetical protein